MKVLAFIFITLFSIAFALIPEGTMYYAWHLIQPVEVWQKIVILSLFWIGGLSICVWFGFIGFALWAFLLRTIA